MRNATPMFKNYFKIGWRNLMRHKSNSLINIVGLSLSIACGILIFTLVNFHLSFDDFHPNKERIYRIVTEIHNQEVSYTPGVPPPFTKAFRNDFTFAEKVARAVNFRGELISVTDGKEIKKFKEENGIVCVEPSFFEIFNFPLVQGDIKHALDEPYTAIITQKIANKYFGTEDAIGKIIRIDNKTDFKITGILKDIPANTDRNQEIYVSDLSMKSLSSFISNDQAWGGINSETHCFVLLKSGITPRDVEKAFPAFMHKYYKPDDLAFVFKVQSLSDIHFNSNYDGYADKKYLWSLSFIGLFLIITACVNFINLSTAHAVSRSKEVGIRKVLGSLRSQLFWQFIAETTLITLFAVILAFMLAELGIPYLNELFKTQLSIHLFRDYKLPLFIILLFSVVVFLAGSYPGLIISGFQPVLALKGKSSQKASGRFSLRRILVVTQFAISQMLIIGTIVIASQMSYSKNSDLGFSKDGIVMLPVPINDSTGKNRMQSLRNRLAAIPGVEDISFCMQAPASQSNNTTDIIFENRPKDEPWGVNTKDADDQYLNTFGLKLVAGRNFYRSDTIREFIVNETLVKKLNLKSPEEIINKNVRINGKVAPVVGVVKDFYNYSFRTDIAAIAIFSNYTNYQNCAVKINLANTKATLSSIEKIWNDVYPEYVFDSQFLDERIARFYELDDIMLKIIEILAAIAIFIGCLGLYGLVSFMAVQKTKEIGVRKVLGAGIWNILWLFGKEFIFLLIIAFVIAAPLAWWAMHRYLQDFKYQIHIGIDLFLAALLGTFIIAAITVSYRSLKAALANPVKSLRSE